MERTDGDPQICTPGASGMDLSFNKEKEKKVKKIIKNKYRKQSIKISK